MKKIITMAVAALALSFAAPAHAIMPAGKSQENYMFAIGKVAWIELKSDSDVLCDVYSMSRNATVNRMVAGIMEATEYQYKRTDARRAMARLMQWGCGNEV
jgi:hypothetical protein